MLTFIRDALTERATANIIIILMLVCVLGRSAWPSPRSWKIASVRIWRYVARTGYRICIKIRVAGILVHFLWIDRWRKIPPPPAHPHEGDPSHRANSPVEDTPRCTDARNQEEDT